MSPSPDRWQRIEALYHSALERDPAARAAFLDGACGHEDDLRREVESLLAEAATGQVLLNGPHTPLPAESAVTELKPGARLGPYQIEGLIGEGGMGKVYRARDTRLGRTVAIKTSAQRFTDRFEREARTIASLNHSNICTLHDVGPNYLVMELVEGPTLAERIKRGPVPLEEALGLARQIADALEAAHEKGIVHRDLKPANIKIRPDGSVKVLDFGLAKAGQDSELASELPTMMSMPGMILGTPGYMSPEQARGEKVDKRTDIWAFGVVVYEMVTGRRLVDEPDWTKVPARLERLLRLCLERDRNRRLRNIGGVELLLNSEGATTAPPRSRLAMAGWTVAAAITLGLATVAFLHFRELWPAVSNGPALARLTADSGLTTDPALSPDGKFLAYASDRGGGGNLDIWVRQVTGGEAIQLTKDPADDHEPVFSADGSRIAFRSERDGGGIYVMSALGGEAKRVADYGRHPQFSPDGSQIAYSIGVTGSVNSPKSYVVPSSGGRPRQIQPDFFSVVDPIWSPDGKRLLFFGWPEESSGSDWWVAPLDGGPAIRTGAVAVILQHKIGSTMLLLPPIWRAETNQIVFAGPSGDAENLWQIALAPNSWQVTGAPRQLTSGAGPDVQPSVAGGHLAFALLSGSTNVWSFPVDANAGKVLGDMGRLTEGPNHDDWPSISTDGSKLVFARIASVGRLQPLLDYLYGPGGIWLKDLHSGKESVLVDSPAWFPRLAADGSRVSYRKVENGRPAVFAVPTTVGEPERVCQDCSLSCDWSHDGRKMLYETDPTPARPRQFVVIVDVASGAKTEILSHSKLGVSHSRFSPDDRWISFHSVTPTARRIFVAPYHGAAAIPEEQWIPVTDGKGMDRYAAWSPDGNLLYFLSERDGFRCIWAQRLDPATKHPSGEAFSVRHFHTSRRSLLATADPIQTGMSVAADKIVFSMVERTGNIWMQNLP